MIVWLVGERIEAFIPVGVYKSLEDAKWAVEAVFSDVVWKPLDHNDWLGVETVDVEEADARYCITPMQVGRALS